MKTSSRLVWPLLLIWVAVLSAQKEDLKAPLSLDGVVLSVAGGQPVAGARVALTKFAIETRSGTSQVQFPEESPFSQHLAGFTFTDASGRFSFKDIDRDVHGLVVAANGFVREEFGLEDFPEAGRPFVVQLRKTGSVSGTVRVSGRPMERVNVQLLKYVYSSTGKKSLKPFASALTDDRGEYRLYFVTPGRYYLRAGTSAQESNSPYAEVVSPLFYPGVENPDLASIVDVESGTERFGLNLTLFRQPMYRLRGRIVSEPKESDSQNRLNLVYAGGGFSTGDDVGNAYKYGRTAADGTFEFRSIAPGNYVLELRGEDYESEGLLPVRVGFSDIDNLVVTRNVGTIHGHLVVEGGPLSAGDARYIRFDLQPLLFGESPEGLLLDSSSLQSSDLDGGKFEIEKVLPIDYRFESGYLPRGYYIKEARLAGIDVLSHPFRSRGGDETLHVVIRSGAGQLSGTVVDDKLRPASKAQVVLVPARTRNRTDLYDSSTTDRGGHFSLSEIAPGDYKVFAWESIEEYSWLDPDVLRRFEARGSTIHVGESSRTTVQVKVIPRM